MKEDNVKNIIAELKKTMEDRISYEDVDTIIKQRTDDAKKIFEKESLQSKVDIIVENCMQYNKF